MSFIKTLWRFGRPHTLIGSIISVSCLYVLATNSLNFNANFAITLLSAISANLFITGYNQWVDVDLDKITKPDLPLASGDLSLKKAKWIIITSLVISLVSALYLSLHFFPFIILICLIGFLYSWKDVYFKKHHLTAALAILVVRGVLVNLGFYLFFSFGFIDLNEVPGYIWVLTVFVVLFSLGIAWFKDIPDRKGDGTHRIQSLVLRYGVQRAFKLGVIIVLLGYTTVSVFALRNNSSELNSDFLFIGNSLAGIIFMALAILTKPEYRPAIRRFYRVFWFLFALEYLLFAIAALI